jgi:hypothetical protein
LPKRVNEIKINAMLNRSKTIRDITRLAFHERKEFFARLVVRAEAAEHTRSCRDRARLLYATHGHA